LSLSLHAVNIYKKTAFDKLYKKSKPKAEQKI
jgi:hypothetical protein